MATNPSGVRERKSKVGYLTSCKASRPGSGSFEGYANHFSVLDSYNDIVLPGAYTDTLEQFIRNGFAAADHSWGVANEIGILTEAFEDSKGLFFRAEFHPTEDAQNLRAKILNRLEKGKAVRLSIGYAADEFRYVKPADAVKYLTPEQAKDPAVLAQLEAASRVRLLTKITLFEVSPVSVPAEPQAAVTGAKSLPRVTTRSKSRRGLSLMDRFDLISELHSTVRGLPGAEVLEKQLKADINRMLEPVRSGDLRKWRR